MTEFKIRPAEERDARLVTTLVAFTRADTYFNPELGLGEQWAHDIKLQMLQNESVQRCATQIRSANEDGDNKLYLVAEDAQGRLDGMVYAERESARYLLDSLFVAQDRRSQGIGSRLMTAYFDWAHEEFPTELYVVSFNERAIAFYERHGFTVVPDSDVEHEGIPKVVMRREVSTKEEK